MYTIKQCNKEYTQAVDAEDAEQEETNG